MKMKTMKIISENSENEIIMAEMAAAENNGENEMVMPSIGEMKAINENMKAKQWRI
jgi:hypothetical protein